MIDDQQFKTEEAAFLDTPQGGPGLEMVGDSSADWQIAFFKSCAGCQPLAWSNHGSDSSAHSLALELTEGDLMQKDRTYDLTEISMCCAFGSLPAPFFQEVEAPFRSNGSAQPVPEAPSAAIFLLAMLSLTWFRANYNARRTVTSAQNMKHEITTSAAHGRSKGGLGSSSSSASMRSISTIQTHHSESDSTTTKGHFPNQSSNYRNNEFVQRATNKGPKQPCATAACADHSPLANAYRR